MPKTFDVVIIGGGIVGASCTYFLAEAGFSVALLERRDLASGTSGACQSNVGIGAGSSGLADYFKAAVSTHALLRDRGIDEGHHTTGGIVFATTEDEAAELRTEVGRLGAVGVQAVMLSEAETRDLEPNLRPGLPGVAFEPMNAQINPMAATVRIAEAARRRGAAILLGNEVVEVDVRDGRIAGVATREERIAASQVVIAAGAWSRDLARLAGLRVPVWPRKGHIIVAEPRAAWIRHILFEYGYEASLGRGFDGGGAAPGVDTPPPSVPEVGTIVQPLPSGQLLVGNSREYAGWDLAVDRQRLRQIAERAIRFLPGLRAVRAIRTYAGLRPWSVDGLPLIGPCAGIEGLWLASGHGGGGITGGPLAGRLIADLLTGAPTVIDPAPFRPDRFGDALYGGRPERAHVGA